MMDLTPVDVRRKKDDFGKGLRGYDTTEVDGFLEVIAERMEALMRENATLRERASQLAEALTGYRGREQAMNEALVTAQQLREEIRAQSQREAEAVLREAKAAAERILEAGRQEVQRERNLLQKARRQRSRFLRSYRSFLEGQLAEIIAEEAQSTPADREADTEEATSGR
jgi:cell division initiation protein